MNPSSPSAPRVPETTAQSALPKEAQILVVDDSVTMRLYLRHSLQALFPGSHVMEAEDGKTALRSLTTARVDLIITDLQMPGMDGQSLVQVLRRNPLLRRKPILVISGALDAPLERELRALGDGALELLAKPVEAVDLQRAVARLLA